MRQQYRLWAFGWMLALCASISAAQVTLDGTLGRAGPLPGPNYAITADLGQQRGGNLFHSFGLFSINRGESATFSGPNSVNNIISRVTGGQVSTIDGVLRSTIPGANLYLLNPAGVLFGENAALDVPGSVHVSTADYVRLGEGGRFDARTPANSVLTVAPAEAFGFLGGTPGRIEINGSFLGVPEGQTLSLIGGDITLTNATVYAPAGRLNVAAVGSAGEVVPTETDLAMQGFGRLGTLTMEHDPEVERVTVNIGEPFGEVPLGDLDTSGVGGGAIFIQGGQWVSRGGMVFADTHGMHAGQDTYVAITGKIQFDEGARLTADTFNSGSAGSVTLDTGALSLNGSVIASNTVSTGAGGNVHLTVADTLTLLNGGVISASTFAQGNAGSVTLTAGNLLVDGQGSDHFTGIASSAESGTGAGGDVTLTIADTLTLLNGGEIRASTFAQGNAGSVTITASNLLVDSSYIASNTQFGSGAGGNVDLDVVDTLTVQNGGQISASSLELGQGNAGNVVINTGNLLVDKQGSEGFTGIASLTHSGAGGGVYLSVADTLTLLNGGEISASTFGQGQAGNVTLTAGNLLVDGQGYGGLTGLTGITSHVNPGSTGSGGEVHVTVAETLTLLNGGRIAANTLGEGNAGNVTVEARNLLIDRQGSPTFTGITSDAASVSTGAGGNVHLTVADTLTLLNGGQIRASTFAGGNAGNVTVEARNLLIDRQGSEDFTGIASSAELGSGAGGEVTLTIADTLTLLNGGTIRASTFAGGDAGSVTITASNLLVDEQGSEDFTGIASSAESGSTGAGGDVTLTIADTLTLLNGGAISASTWGAGDAGAVTLTAGNLLVDEQGSEDFTGIASSAESGSTGAGGDINLTVADTLTLLNGGEISASTFAGGAAGNVTLTAGNLLVDRQGSDSFTGIASSANSGSTGAGGDINLTVADTLTLLNGGEISASTFAGGAAGNVTLTAGNLLVDGQGSDDFTGITSSANSGSTGAGGDMTVTVADALTVRNGGQISASTLGEGEGGDIISIVGGSATITGGVEINGRLAPSGLFVRAYSTGKAGDLTLTTPHLTLADGGTISATSELTTGGNLLINADHLKMFNGSISSTAFGDVPGSDGGNVTLNSTNIVALNGSTITARANKGQGGNITVNAQVFLHDAPSTDDVLNASSDTFGNDGTVELNAPTTDISGSLVTLNTPYLDVAGQLSPGCVGGKFAEERSRFVVQGRDALPLSPEEALPASVERCEPPPPTVPPVTGVHSEPPAEFPGFGDR